MRKFLFVFAAFLMAFAAQAQEKVRSVSLEVFGAQNTVGINYDSRFKGNDGWDGELDWVSDMATIPVLLTKT